MKSYNPFTRYGGASYHQSLLRTAAAPTDPLIKRLVVGLSSVVPMSSSNSTNAHSGARSGTTATTAPTYSSSSMNSSSSKSSSFSSVSSSSASTASSVATATTTVTTSHNPTLTTTHNPTPTAMYTHDSNAIGFSVTTRILQNCKVHQEALHQPFDGVKGEGIGEVGLTRFGYRHRLPDEHLPIQRTGVGNTSSNYTNTTNTNTEIHHRMQEGSGGGVGEGERGGGGRVSMVQRLSKPIDIYGHHLSKESFRPQKRSENLMKIRSWALQKHCDFGGLWCDQLLLGGAVKRAGGGRGGVYDVGVGSNSGDNTSGIIIDSTDSGGQHNQQQKQQKLQQQQEKEEEEKKEKEDNEEEAKEEEDIAMPVKRSAILQPYTPMPGQAVRLVLQSYRQIQPEHILVIEGSSAIPVGQMRLATFPIISSLSSSTSSPVAMSARLRDVLEACASVLPSLPPPSLLQALNCPFKLKFINIFIFF